MKKDFIVRRSITMIDGKPHVETYSEQELVRCKDCRFMYEDGQFMCGMRGICVNEDFFCADGERKEVK